MVSAIAYTPKNRLLAALPPEDRERLLSTHQPVPLELRQVLYEVDAPLEHVYFIEQGVVSVLTIMANGSTIEVGMIGFEGMAGAAGLLGSEVGTQRYIVQVPGTALRMRTAECKAAFDQSADFRGPILRFLASMIDLGAQTAACNRLHTIEQRCARWLLMAHDRLQSDVMPMTHEFLASMLGVRRAGVTETAGELQRSGLIRYHHGQVAIIDREGLEVLACECAIAPTTTVSSGCCDARLSRSTRRKHPNLSETVLIAATGLFNFKTGLPISTPPVLCCRECAR